MEVNIEIKLANRSNFTEFSMDSFDRFQEVRNVYRIENGKLVLKNTPFTESWSPERKREKASEILSGQYITYCAFDGNTVVGEIMLIPELNEDRMIIDSFHVSRDYRRHGIGRQMIETVADYAKSRGAEVLYASCCSAEETIAFYMAMGFRPSAHPIPSCVRDEPFDIQMEFPIGVCRNGSSFTRITDNGSERIIQIHTGKPAQHLPNQHYAKWQGDLF